MSNYAIEVQGLSHTYLRHERAEGLLDILCDIFKRKYVSVYALQDISFTIQPGEIVGLLGPNGAGKTTLLKILSGLIHPTKGRVEVIGNIPYQKKHSFLKKIGMVMGQKSQLLWDIPTSSTLQIIRELYDIPKCEFDARLNQFTEMLSIGNLLHTPVRTLSLGERMKFELIAALIHNPQVLFLDEPTIGLDVVSQRIIRDFLLAINNIYKTTIIITSHYMRDIEVLAKRMCIIQKGCIQYNDSIEQLLKNFEHLHRIILETTGDIIELSSPFIKIQNNKYIITCRPDQVHHIVTEIASKVTIRSLRTEEASLEEAIFSIFSQNAKASL